MTLAPISLFTYNRPWHTRQTVEALLKNDLAGDSELIVFSDGPKNPQDEPNIDEVRQYIRAINGFRKVTVIERTKNLGLAPSVIKGVTDVLAKHDRIIVLEDDMVTSPFFLRFMNDALELYRNEEKVISVHGYIAPVSEKLPNTFFLRCTDCWGWATWKRGWELFEEDGKKLLSELEGKGLANKFDLDGSYRYVRMLKDQIAGRKSSWAVRWYASAFVHERLSLRVGVSLIQHIGNDGSGTNVGACDKFDVSLSNVAIPVESIPIAENLETRKIVANYMRSIRTPFPKAILNYVKKLLEDIFQR